MADLSSFGAVFAISVIRDYSRITTAYTIGLYQSIQVANKKGGEPRQVWYKRLTFPRRYETRKEAEERASALAEKYKARYLKNLRHYGLVTET